MPQARLVRRLARCLDTADARTQLIETDISWVLLAGGFAYKFKKAIRRDVLDYGSLAARRFACEEELRLNRRLAPELYLGLSTATGSQACPSMDGVGPALDVAVRMRRFPQSALWQARLDAGQLGTLEVKELAALLADFHARAPRATRALPWGSGRLIRARTMQDLDGIVALASSSRQQGMLADIASWIGAQHHGLKRIFARRKEDGWVRECHGDLHLANILTLDGLVRVFDGIEFSPGLRWIDVAQDLAFIWMDLQCHGQPRLAARLLNDYLERSGDYGSLAVLPYYRVQRALVRCKVALQRTLPGTPGRIAALKQAARYLAFAHAHTVPGAASLIIAHGLSGSGKSWLCDALVEPLEAVRLRSDVERKRLYAGAVMPATGWYDSIRNAATYRRLARLARTALLAGFTVLVDAAFLERDKRLVFCRLAQRCHVAFLLLHVSAPLALLQSRLAERAASGHDPSDADHAVLAGQMARFGPQGLLAEELGNAVVVLNDAGFGSVAVAGLACRLRRTLRRNAAPVRDEHGVMGSDDGLPPVD